MQNSIIEELICDSYIQRRPLICTIELTTACAFQCVHCYAKEGGVTPRFLATETVIKHIDKLVKAGCLYIVFTGGDPLLHPDFEKIYRYTRSKCNVSVFTNGFSLSKSVFALFKELPPSKIEITLYGASEETYYRTTGVKAFSTVMSSLRLLQEIKANILIKAFFVRENYCDYASIKRIAESLSLPYKFDSFIVAEDTSEKYKHQLPINQLKQIYMDMSFEKTKIEYNIKLHGIIQRRGNNKFYRCGAGRYSAWIKSDNTLNMCAFSSAKSAISLYMNSFSDAWNLLADEAERDIPEKIMCKSCDNWKNCLICPTKYMAICTKENHELNVCRLARGLG